MSAPLAWIDVLTKDLPREERDRSRLELRNILNASARVGQWDATKTGIIQSEFVDPSGAVRIDGAGVHLYNSLDLETIWIKSIGDMFIGSNIAAASTTNFVFLSTDQTYNSESLGAGDLLIGDNSASKANMLWDASAGILYFRGGTTNQAWVDTTGAVTAGGGDVVIDDSGIQILQGIGSSNNIHWRVSVPDGSSVGTVGVYTAGSAPNRYGIAGLTGRPESGAAASTFGEAGLFSYEEFGAGQIVASNIYCFGQTAMFQVFTSASANLFSFTIDPVNGIRMLSGTTRILSASSSALVANEDGADIDLRIEGATATSLLLLDAGLDAVQIGTTVAGAIADFRATSIVFNDGAAAMDLRMEDDSANDILFMDADGFSSTGQVFIGQSTLATGIGASKFNVTATGAISGGQGMTLTNPLASGAGSGAGILMYSHDGAALASGDRLGFFTWGGYDGAAARNSVALEAFAAEAWSSGVAGAYFKVSVAPTGSATRAEAFRVNADGTIRLSNATSWTANGTATITISNVGPAGIGTATISKWLTVEDNAGGVMYIPAFT